jgi:4-aminobutyrate aminotransferase
MGKIFLDGLLTLQTKYPIIGEARGLGLMVAMEMIVPGDGKIPNPRAVADLLDGCLERGLLATNAGLHGHVIRFMPPLSINEEQVNEGLGIIEDSLASL